MCGCDGQQPRSVECVEFDRCTGPVVDLRSEGGIADYTCIHLVYNNIASPSVTLAQSQIWSVRMQDGTLMRLLIISHDVVFFYLAESQSVRSHPTALAIYGLL